MALSLDKIELLISERIEAKISSIIKTYLWISGIFCAVLISLLVYMFLQTSITIKELKISSINMITFMETSKVKEGIYLEEQFQIKQLIQGQRETTQELYNYIIKNK